MLIVAGFLDVEPEHRDEFISGRVDLMRASRDEPGCITYAFSADPIDPGRILLFERWESKGALAAHLEVLRSSSPPAGDVKILGAEVLQYEISEVGPLGS